jgi:hypothetical protein
VRWEGEIGWWGKKVRCEVLEGGEPQAAIRSAKAEEDQLARLFSYCGDHGARRAVRLILSYSFQCFISRKNLKTPALSSPYFFWTSEEVRDCVVFQLDYAKNARELMIGHI